MSGSRKCKSAASSRSTTAKDCAAQVSVIVCNLNGDKFLPRLIESLQTQRGVEVEIIVVDRESKDGSLEYLAGVPGVKVVSEPAATGLVAGYHAAVPAATHDLLFFCNEDLWLDQDCLSSLARHISLPRKIGAADPWQWSYDGARHIHGGTAFVRAFLDPINCYPPRALDFLFPLKSGEPVPFACSGALLVHRRMYLETGGWDTSFFMEFDDVDFFLRAWQRGWTCVSEPEAKVYHAVGMAMQQPGAPPGKIRKKRRITSESNRAVICLKHFTGVSILWALVLLCRPLLAHTLHLRFQEARTYVAALKFTCKRLPAVIRFRKANCGLIRDKPGQKFFTETIFQRREPAR